MVRHVPQFEVFTPNSCTLAFKNAFSLPYPYSDYREEVYGLGLNDIEDGVDAYAELHDELIGLYSAGGCSHRMFGYTDYDSELDVHYASKNKEKPSWGEEFTQEDMEQVKDWMPLLQVGYDQNAGVCIGSINWTYYMCRNIDIAARNFGKSWTLSNLS